MKDGELRKNQLQTFISHILLKALRSVSCVIPELRERFFLIGDDFDV